MSLERVTWGKTVYKNTNWHEDKADQLIFRTNLEYIITLKQAFKKIHIAVIHVIHSRVSILCVP